jgi:hypothetical protein
MDKQSNGLYFTNKAHNLKIFDLHQVSTSRFYDCK